VESYIASLRSELEQTKAQLRRKEETKPERRRERTPEEQSPVEAEALTRHNARLEATIAELHQQLEDLRTQHEAVAESRLLRTGEPLEEGSAEQLRTLLSIQLNEGYETYLAMRQEALDKVFRLDYRDLLGKVFETLIGAGVPLNPKIEP
jgi:dynactin complex subunit